MSDIKFVTEPPPTRYGRRRSSMWQQIADTLRSNPNQWALVAASETSGATRHIVTGAYRAFRPAGAFEATARSIPGTNPLRVDVYARYVGNGAEPEVLPRRGSTNTSTNGFD